MKKSVLKAILILGATLFTFIANVTAASACFIGMYQPETPKPLREE